MLLQTISQRNYCNRQTNKQTNNLTKDASATSFPHVKAHQRRPKKSPEFSSDNSNVSLDWVRVSMFSSVSFFWMFVSRLAKRSFPFTSLRAELKFCWSLTMSVSKSFLLFSKSAFRPCHLLRSISSRHPCDEAVPASTRTMRTRSIEGNKALIFFLQFWLLWSLAWKMTITKRLRPW